MKKISEQNKKQEAPEAEVKLGLIQNTVPGLFKYLVTELAKAPAGPREGEGMIRYVMTELWKWWEKIGDFPYRCPTCDLAFMAGEPCPGCGVVCYGDEFTYCSVCEKEIYTGDGDDCGHMFWSSHNSGHGGAGADDEADFTEDVMAAILYCGPKFMTSLGQAMELHEYHIYQSSHYTFSLTDNTYWIEIDYRSVPEEAEYRIANGLDWLLTLRSGGKTYDADRWVLGCVQKVRALDLCLGLVWWWRRYEPPEDYVRRLYDCARPTDHGLLSQEVTV